MVSLGDVAARAGVSVSAVSRVLNDHPSARVSAATRERILVAARELQYRPNFAGRALKSARTRVLGLLVPDLTNALFADLLQGVEDEARAHGYAVLLARCDPAGPDGELVARLIGEGRVDGMVVQFGDRITLARRDELLASPAPVVVINSVHPGRGIATVVFDDAAGARTATEHLLGLGHTRIALAGGLRRSSTAGRRAAGYRTALAAAGLGRPPQGYETRLGYTADDGRTALRRLLELPVPPSAVVVANVNAAVGLLAEARAAAVRVPRDLSVVCVHDSWTAQNTWPPLTAVRMPFGALGRAAVRAVLDRIETGQRRAETVTDPPPELIVRESCARPRPSPRRG